MTDALEQAARVYSERHHFTNPYIRDAFIDGYRQGSIAAVREADALREERDRLRTIEHAARDVDGAWFTESDEDQAPILWIAEAGEILLDLRAALSATEPAE